MKKIISAVLAAVFVISAAACSGNPAEGENNAQTTAVTEQEENVIDKGEMRGITAKELVSEMKIGWNLGNTLDANGSKNLSSETSWGNPRTTKEMIDAVAAAGFNTIRIPTTWYNHIDDEESYTINEEWFKRVEEVVGYALANDMYVILNMHHEDSWLIPDEEHIEGVKAQFEAMWKQIAAYFADYGDHLLFEGMNEPRVVGGKFEWTGGTPEGRSCINTLNQLFVDTVRASGGNNAKRALLITTFAAQVTNDSFDGFVIPEDDNLIVSLHAYTPYRFTYDSKGESWNALVFDEGVERDIKQTFTTINTFLGESGIPVIITECGACVKKDEDGVKNIGEVAKWINAYVSIAKENGIPCVFWDNGYFYSGNELFGLFDRTTLTWFAPEIIESAMKALEE